MKRIFTIFSVYTASIGLLFAQSDAILDLDFASGSLTNNGTLNFTQDSTTGNILGHNNTINNDFESGIYYTAPRTISANSISLVFRADNSIQPLADRMNLISGAMGDTTQSIFLGEGTGVISNEVITISDQPLGGSGARTAARNIEISNKWHALVITFDTLNGYYRINLDGFDQGVSHAGRGATPLMRFNSFSIFTSFIDNSSSLEAMIDVFRIHERVLSQNEIDDLVAKADSLNNLPTLSFEFENGDLTNTGTVLVNIDNTEGNFSFSSINGEEICSIDDSTVAIINASGNLNFQSVSFLFKPQTVLNQSTGPAQNFVHTKEADGIGEGIFFGSGTSVFNSETLTIFNQPTGGSGARTAMLGDSISDEWHSFAFVYDESVNEYIIYIDSVEQSTFSGGIGHTPLISMQEFALFWRTDRIQNSIVGDVDDVMFYDKMLTFQEIQAAAVKANDLNDSSLSKEELSTELKLYPNPSSDVVYFGTSTEISYVLYDIQGAKIKAGIASQLDIARLSNGTYMVQINGKMHKFIKI